MDFFSIINLKFVFLSVRNLRLGFASVIIVFKAKLEDNHTGVIIQYYDSTSRYGEETFLVHATIDLEKKLLSKNRKFVILSPMGKFQF